MFGGGIVLQCKFTTAVWRGHQPGDYVLIHTGFAIQKIDKEEAKASLQAFEAFKKLNEEMDAEEKENNTHLI